MRTAIQRPLHQPWFATCDSHNWRRSSRGNGTDGMVHGRVVDVSMLAVDQNPL
jgi:hypothetical protein